MAEETTRSLNKAITLMDLCQKIPLESGGLSQDKVYRVERASFGPVDGLSGQPRDQNRAHLVLREVETGRMFYVYPRYYSDVGADGGGYPEVALECQPIT